MFCNKCGTKNELDAKYCENCGNKLESKKTNKFLEKFKALPKKTKLAMGGVIILVGLAMLVLFILLNEPVKKVSDNLDEYYANYKENYVKDLSQIKNILNDEKDAQDTLNDIKKTSNSKIKAWVKNFNANYKNRDELDQAYKKIKEILNTIYEYYNGNQYILGTDLYQEQITLLSNLYSSKVNYLYGLNTNDEYAKYTYFERVIETDCYYKEAQKYIEDYVKEELNRVLEDLANIITSEDLTKEELLDKYLEQLDYLDKNKVVNNVDLSNTDKYKEALEKVVNNIMDTLKEIVKELENKVDYNKAYNLVTQVIKVIKDEEKQKELEELKDNLEEKLPDNLVDKLVVGYVNSYDADYEVTINKEKYQSFIEFSFNGKTAYRTYRLNKNYKRFKATLVVGDNWPADFKGEIVITSGEKELFRSGEITSEGNFKKDIDIILDDVQEMKIEFITSNDGGNSGYYLYIVEPYLYK